MRFSDIGLNKSIQKAITDLGFEALTPIQQEVIDLVMGLNAIYAGATGIHYMVKNGF